MVGCILYSNVRVKFKRVDQHPAYLGTMTRPRFTRLTALEDDICDMRSLGL